jgi:ATP-dependent DNA helicase RecG
VIEHAERFGLSQLHQLRGRVGRGAHASECFLVANFHTSDDAWRRLSIMEQTTDGFRIAEEDLAIRGPGDFMGTRQAGLPMLSIANLARDGALLVAARADAQRILDQDPNLHALPHQALANLLAAAHLGLIQVG